MTMTIAEAVWLHASTHPELMSLLGTDPVDGAPYLFQDDLIMSSEYLENSQKSALVVSHQGEWRSPLDTNTTYFPRLQFDLYTDPDRHPDHSPVSTSSAKNKAEDIIRVLDHIFHRVGPFDERWGEYRVLSTSRLVRYRSSMSGRGGEFKGVADGNGLEQSTLYYGLIYT